MKVIPGFLFLFLHACSPNNVTVENALGKHFTNNNVAGCFALFNNNNGNFTVYNLDRYRDSAYLPASTFKIVNSLIGLQTGIITNDSMIIKWDGVTRALPQWNKDLSMYEAFRVSSVPYYQEVARRIGKERMQYWLDSLAYGTFSYARASEHKQKITSAIDTFWLDNSLKITADEQLGLVKKLYFNQLPFFKEYQQTVKTAMLFEDKPEYKLSYKTGGKFWDSTSKKHLGWVVGFIEENKHPYFFVLNIESGDENFDMPTVRMKMLKGILGELGFFKGIK